MASADTIFALSSGAPPAGIAVIRISGPRASATLRALAGRLPEPRRAALARFVDPASGEALDQGLMLWFPGPATATGEDLAELHLHGGRAVVRAVEDVLAGQPGLRRAEAGEFTRRAFTNGRIDLAEAEGLADLLTAETEWQRQAALSMAEGRLSRDVADWRDKIIYFSALVEAELDFGDEDDVKPSVLGDLQSGISSLAADIGLLLDQPPAERLREGVRVVLAGPPNSGKSTLLNALVDREAAIVSPIAGTTRDLIEVPVAFAGVPFLLTDTAGLRDEGAEIIEAIGIERAARAIERADILLWLGPEGEGPAHPLRWEIDARIDALDHVAKRSPRLRVSAATGQGIAALIEALVEAAEVLLPPAGSYAINQRQRHWLTEAKSTLEAAAHEADPLLVAEGLRGARAALDALIGNTHVEAMLDALFGRFCIGK